MKRFGFKVSSDRPYEITTMGSVNATGWPAASARAIREHIVDLKIKGKNRKRNSFMTVKLWVEGTTEKPAEGTEKPAEEAKSEEAKP